MRPSASPRWPPNDLGISGLQSGALHVALTHAAHSTARCKEIAAHRGSVGGTSLQQGPLATSPSEPRHRRRSRERSNPVADEQNAPGRGDVTDPAEVQAPTRSPVSGHDGVGSKTHEATRDLLALVVGAVEEIRKEVELFGRHFVDGDLRR